MRAELTPIGGDGFAAIKRGTAAFNFARPRLVHVILVRFVQALEQACGDLSTVVLWQAERRSKELFRVNCHDSSLAKVEAISDTFTSHFSSLRTPPSRDASRSSASRSLRGSSERRPALRTAGWR